MGFRTVKRNGNRDLHNAMKVPVIAYRGGTVSEALPINVRVHSKVADLGGLAGTSLQYADMRERSPKLVFDILEFAPGTGDVISVDDTEVYRLGAIDPIDGEFQTGEAILLSKTQALGYPGP